MSPQIALANAMLQSNRYCKSRVRVARTPKFQRIPEPLLPDEFNISFAPFFKPTGVMHLFRFFISRTKEMRDAHWSLYILNAFTAVLCNNAVNGSAPVKILDPGNA
jgi:hypothetical protein